MTQKTYTAEQKDQAVALFISEGATAAAEAIGCTRRAIYNWLGQYGVHAENDEEKRLATLERHRQKREALAEVFLDQSMSLALAADPDQALDAQRLMTAAAIASQKHLELTGGPGSAAPFVLTEEIVVAEILRLETELGKVAPNNKRALAQASATEVDKALSQTLDEWETKIRAEVKEELTGKDALGRPVKTPEQWNEAADNINNPNGHQPLEGSL